MSETSTERIIGDSLEINADIIYNYSISKAPKFIKDIKSNYYRSKLIKTVSKLRDANEPLTIGNLVEYFAYVYNNFPTNPSYKSIHCVRHIESTDIWEAVIVKDEYNALIKINNTTDELSIDLTKKLKSGSLESYSKILAAKCLNGSKVSDISKEVDDINITLIRDITDYIIDTVSLYGN